MLCDLSQLEAHLLGVISNVFLLIYIVRCTSKMHFMAFVELDRGTENVDCMKKTCLSSVRVSFFFLPMCTYFCRKAIQINRVIN